jgi:transposase, IS30 family
VNFPPPLRAIAAWMGRSPSTISRELRWNRNPGSGWYRPFTAQKLATQRAWPRPGVIAADRVLRQLARDRLEKLRSPQQVSRTLPGVSRRAGPLCHA